MKKIILGFIGLCICAAAAVKGLSGENGQLLSVEKNQSSAGKKTQSSAGKVKTGEASGGQVEVLARMTEKAGADGEIMLRRTGYVTSYNPQTKQPNWVGWRLTADHANGPYKRGGIKFQEDEDVPEPRATDADYRGSGYDRGHMCPSGDCKWSEEAQSQSFLFTNICPQIHGLNAGDWNEIEQQCRRWAEQMGEIYIVSGPVFYTSARHKRIGKNKLPVPEAFFKVVLCMQGTPKAIGFIYKNQGGNRPKGDYVNTVDEVERITGIDFFPSLPDDVENRVEATASLDDWY